MTVTSWLLIVLFVASGVLVVWAAADDVPIVPEPKVFTPGRHSLTIPAPDTEPLESWLGGLRWPGHHQERTVGRHR